MNRSVLWVAVALMAGACSDEASSHMGTAEAQPVTERSIEADPRVAGLLFECSQDQHFGEDTSNLIPVLVGKLVSGQRDPLRGAKRDLAEYGEAAVPELSALVDSQVARGANSDVLLNVLSTIALMEGATGGEIALRLLERPEEIIRIAALRALAGRMGPEDFDRVVGVVPGASRALQSACVAPLFDASPERLLAQLERWVEAGTERAMWVPVIQLLAGEPELAVQAGRLRSLLENSDVPVARESFLRLQVLFASVQDEAAMADLLSLRDSKVTALQYIAIEGLARAELGAELKQVMRTSGDVKLRVLAAEAIGKLPQEKAWTDALTLGLSDEDETVRKICLTHLLARGDEAALDFAFSLLESSSSDRQLALDALAEPMKASEELTAELLEVLKTQLEVGSTMPERVPFYQSIGQLPSAGAAEYLLARTVFETDLVDGLDAHRWIALQAGNTGAAGRTVIAEAWRTEPDPIRRLDLLAALFAGRSSAVRSILSEAATREDVSPFEVLVAADYLTRIGPAQECAPLLKRVALRCSEGRVRRALQCLLWRFYGA